MLLLIILSTVLVAKAAQFDYYWRDYNGEIYSDAIPGGLDKNENPTYIAQLYVEHKGILPTRLYQGDRSVTASRHGIHTSDHFIKILCSQHPEKFVWLPVTSRDLQIQTIGRHLVQGGNEDGKIVNIGRVQFQGELIVGKVCTYNSGDARLFFPYRNSEEKFSSYEVLIYDNNVATPTVH